MNLFDNLKSLGARTPVQSEDPTRRPAAVALICAPDPDAILIIKRAERLGDPWSGQMGLPGGRASVTDSDLMATAIRETQEEVGIELDLMDCIATLDDLVPQTVQLPRIRVRPSVRVPARASSRGDSERGSRRRLVGSPGFAPLGRDLRRI